MELPKRSWTPIACVGAVAFALFLLPILVMGGLAIVFVLCLAGRQFQGPPDNRPWLG